eukprot:353045-Chlamydomonas_euryale.AAC.1
MTDAFNVKLNIDLIACGCLPLLPQERNLAHLTPDGLQPVSSTLKADAFMNVSDFNMLLTGALGGQLTAHT